MRRHQKLSLCLQEMVPDGSKMNSLLAKVKPFSDVGRTSVMPYVCGTSVTRSVRDAAQQQLSINTSFTLPSVFLSSLQSF